jgi:hypothetical protein
MVITGGDCMLDREAGLIVAPERWISALNYFLV